MSFKIASSSEGGLNRVLGVIGDDVSFVNRCFGLLRVELTGDAGVNGDVTVLMVVSGFESLSKGRMILGL